jgi:hypothetical protein
MADEKNVDSNWPRAELFGGPLDGRKILAPEPKYSAPLAFPVVPEGHEHYDDIAARIAVTRWHWYVPMTVKNLLKKLSVFYYAYAGETSADDPEPNIGALYDRSIVAHPPFSEDPDTQTHER